MPNCLASRCMSWFWVLPYKAQFSQSFVIWWELHCNANDSKRNYCRKAHLENFQKVLDAITQVKQRLATLSSWMGETCNGYDSIKLRILHKVCFSLHISRNCCGSLWVVEWYKVNLQKFTDHSEVDFPQPSYHEEGFPYLFVRMWSGGYPGTLCGAQSY